MDSEDVARPVYPSSDFGFNSLCFFSLGRCKALSLISNLSPVIRAESYFFFFFALKALFSQYSTIFGFCFCFSLVQAKICSNSLCDFPLNKRFLEECCLISKYLLIFLNLLPFEKNCAVTESSRNNTEMFPESSPRFSWVGPPDGTNAHYREQGIGTGPARRQLSDSTRFAGTRWRAYCITPCDFMTCVD